MDGGEEVDPIVAGAILKAGQAGEKLADSVAAETGGLLRRLLGPSADVIGQDWADRLRQRNMARLLRKTEKHAEGNPDPGWAQPRVAAAVFEAAQYANDEIVTDYLSGVLASSRAPEGGNDDALPWSNLVSRLSALQLRIHYVAYANFRQILRAAEDKTRLFEFKSNQIALPMRAFLSAVGLDPDGSDFQRFADALQGLRQEDLLSDFAYGNRAFFNEQEEKGTLVFKYMPKTTRRLETPYDDVLLLGYSPFGVQFFLWGVGLGMAHDTDYLDPERSLELDDPDELVSRDPIKGVGFTDSFWVEYDAEGNVVNKQPEEKDEQENDPAGSKNSS